MKKIESRQNELIKYVYSLKDKKNQEKEGLFIDEGFNNLSVALEKKLVKMIFAKKNINIKENIPFYLTNENVLNKIAFSINPEIVFVSSFPKFEKKEYKKILYLEEINDPGNLGTLIRTASSFNFDAVMTSSNSVYFYNYKVIAASKGAIYQIPCLNKDINELKGFYPLIMTALHREAKDVSQIKKIDKFVLVLGNEAHGLKERTLKLANEIYYIPLKNMESLNVSSAGAILMYLLTKDNL